MDLMNDDAHAVEVLSFTWPYTIRGLGAEIDSCVVSLQCGSVERRCVFWVHSITLETFSKGQVLSHERHHTIPYSFSTPPKNDYTSCSLMFYRRVVEIAVSCWTVAGLWEMTRERRRLTCPSPALPRASADGWPWSTRKNTEVWKNWVLTSCNVMQIVSRASGFIVSQTVRGFQIPSDRWMTEPPGFALSFDALLNIWSVS